MDLRDIGWSVMEWIHLAKEGSCEHINKRSGCIKSEEILE
jgi:hypothetical protein